METKIPAVPANPPAPGASAATATPPAAPAPSAPANQPAKPLTLADYDRLAAESLMANTEPPAQQPSPVPAGTPSPAPASEGQPAASPPAPAPSAGQEPSPASAAAAPPAPAVQTPGADEEDITDPTPEELALLNEPGQRALKAEREKRKAARAENTALKTRIAELEKAVTPQPSPGSDEPPAPAPAGEEPGAPPESPTPSVATPALADCHTFEAIEARGLAAAQTESQVQLLQNKLQYEGAEAVQADLRALGVEKLGSTPIAEATPAQLAGFLTSALAGARQTQMQVEPRKRFLTRQATSYAQAVKALPEMDNPKSATYRKIAAFVKANPQVRENAQWPLLVAKLYLGEQAFEARLKPAGQPPAASAPAKPPVIKPAPETMPPTTPPALASAPGAPLHAGGTPPPGNRLAELSAKIAAGTATLAEVDEYGRLQITVST